jgi:uncharacterized protein YjbJ (UPF0337 family)
MAMALQNSSSGDGVTPFVHGRRIMNRDELKGKAEKAKGYVKEETGELIDDKELEAEGRAERASGTVREGIGRAKEKVRDTVDDLTDDK